MTEAHPEKHDAALISSSQTLSSAKFTSQFLDDNLEITVNDVLNDPVEPEVQSLMDIPVIQEVTSLEKKVHEMSSFNLPEAIDKSMKAHLKNVLPKYVPYYGKIKLEKAKKSMPKNSSTLVDQAALDECEEKD
ncbi:hypothetical protein Tco_0621685 [Tanacetum coccineum]